MPSYSCFAAERRDAKIRLTARCGVASPHSSPIAPPRCAPSLGVPSRALAAEPSLEEPGLFTTEYLSEESEGYRIEARVLDGAGVEIGTGEVARALNPEAGEFARLGPDPALLGRLAENTGGKLLSLAELGQLPGLLGKLDLPVVEIKQTPLWHTPWLFLIALLCFLGEWALRRRSGVI